jgi:hypothetical protein
MAYRVIFACALSLGYFNGITASAGEGNKPYTPTRLEWLAVQANATFGRDHLYTELGYRIQFFPSPREEDTIQIVAIHVNDHNERMMKADIEASHKVLIRSASRYGWDKWLKVHKSTHNMEGRD